MAQLKNSTLIRKMRENPSAVREFLDTLKPAQLAEYFPDHIIMVRMKRVVNLATGREIIIPANTPRSCDPSSELYHAM